MDQSTLYTPDAIENLRGHDRLAIRRNAAEGIVADLSRDNVIVHTGKPIGSVTGWVGALFWQVWLEPYDAAGVVRARIDEGPSELWTFDSSLDQPGLLAVAAERMVETAKAERLRRYDIAKADLDALSAA